MAGGSSGRLCRHKDLLCAWGSRANEGAPVIVMVVCTGHELPLAVHEPCRFPVA